MDCSACGTLNATSAKGFFKILGYGQTAPIAPIEAESPQFKNLFFAGAKQRPTEARFVACKKRFLNEDL